VGREEGKGEVAGTWRRERDEEDEEEAL